MKRVAPSGDNNPPAKRTKASQACQQCRRQKSRCEILDIPSQPGAPVTIRCHRCKVLGAECSFETSNLIHFAASTTPQTPTSHPSPATPPVTSPATLSYDPPAGSPEFCTGLNTLAAVASSRPNVSSSRPNTDLVRSNPIPNPGTPNQYGMSTPEDLLPTATTPVWGSSLSRVDWTATPMLAIQELVRCPRTETVFQPGASRLSDILSPQETTSLLDIFETRYSPWLCAQPDPALVQSTGSLLDIVRCTIASRHMSPGLRATIAPKLQKLTEDVFLREIFNPQPSLDSIRALLVLSVWAPICGTGAEVRDGRLLIASAVSMAMNLRLQEESKRTFSLRAAKTGAAELNDSNQRWRLWVHLSISESLLCIGTGRMPVSHLSQLDHDMVSLSSSADFTLSAVRDVRLGLSAKMFEISEAALKLRIKSIAAADMGPFFTQINTFIASMEGLSRLLTPLPVITQFDTFYSGMLILQYNACRLLIIHHALREMRTVHEREAPQLLWYKAAIEGHCISLFWGRMALISSENVLTTFLAASDLTLLSTAPDNLYVMVGFAATWIFVSNFSIYQLGGEKLGGASERLQSMAIDRLNQIAHSPDHSAARCGHMLAALMTAWERRKPREDDCAQPCAILDAAGFGTQPDGADGYMDHMARYTDPEQLAPTAQPSNADLFMDDAFWTAFVENLNSDTFIAQNTNTLGMV
ncbi:hypothetical protein B0H16DRAFT_1603590 [Mycena metata]|uniref:Zn(2)-C6 fungal-type domain-containing protein n=1 Tax=Mycena metata TaxID=1033252 RepID=A0AAD7HHR8_9AGAR|nr:hypothetical protein B0H16DRAFT_1603590 [Mycena metata]